MISRSSVTGAFSSSLCKRSPEGSNGWLWDTLQGTWGAPSPTYHNLSQRFPKSPSDFQDYEADPHVKFAGLGLLHCAAGHCTTLPWDCMQRLLKEGLQVPPREAEPIETGCMSHFSNSPQGKIEEVSDMISPFLLYLFFLGGLCYTSLIINNRLPYGILKPSNSDLAIFTRLKTLEWKVGS